MNRKSYIGLAAILAAALAALFAVTLAQAQGPQPPRWPNTERPAVSQAAVGTAFIYQGRLEDASGPISGTCSFAFDLYNDPLTGSSLGTENKPGVQLIDGYFAVGLDFGAAEFRGDARYLQIQVDCGGGPQTLSPRVGLNPTPYAISLRPGAAIDGNVMAGAALYAENTYVGAFASPGIQGVSTNDTGVYGDGSYAGVYGTGSTYGVDADGITGVRGQGTSTGVLGEGPTGVQGTSSSSSGRGVYGYNSSTSGTAYGVLGISSSSTSNAAGVRGEAGSNGGAVYGVYGYNSSGTSGAAGVYGNTAGGVGTYGVYGNNNSSSGTNYGVYGTNNSSDGAGVLGLSQNASGVGVRGETEDGHGVEGVVDWTAGGTGIGVYGQGGLYGSAGYFENTTSNIPAVEIKNQGYASGWPALEVWGSTTITADVNTEAALFVENTDSSGSNAHGVYGRSNSGNGIGVVGYNTNSGGTGVWGESGYVGVRGRATERGVVGQTTGNGYQAWAVAGYASGQTSHAGHFENNYQGGDYTSTVAIWGGSYFGDIIQGHELDSSGNPINTRFRITYDGYGYIDHAWGTPAGDFAEMLPGADGLEPGDVLVVGPDGTLIRSTSAYASAVVGVYSTEPGFIGGVSMDGPEEGDIPLAVVGVVPVKASAENGPINPGDLLTSSSIPGHAMTAGDNPPNGTIVGKALGSLESGTGTIMMLVMLQ